VKSTGNDIVALNAIDIQRTISPAFYSKFITPPELELYKQSQLGAIPFENFVWLLWSVKESVYKYLKRSQPDLIFPPAKIIIQNINVPHTLLPGSTVSTWESGNSTNEFYTGEVAFQSYQLYFRSKITAEFIASVVAGSVDFNEVYWGVESIHETDSETQSKEVRAFALKKLKAILNNNGLIIEKDAAGCPIIMDGNEQLDIPVSLAHHHNLIAFSFSVRG